MSGKFVISLDFELLCGVWDHSDKQAYGPNVLGARDAVPRMVELFAARDIRATWATVGFLFCETKDELIAALPAERPAYVNPRLSNYTYLPEVGKDERSDPYYFAASLVDAICNTPGQELGTHTMSHYYCLEDGQTLANFRDDLVAAKALADLRGVSLRSIVFPRNRFSPAHLEVCARQGITHCRENPAGWAYRAAKGSEQTQAKRALRLIDAFSGVLGTQTFVPRREGMVDVPASRFLRPCAGKPAAFHPLHLGAIKRGMTDAAKTGRGYHLWWHPHNFGRNLDANMNGLRLIIDHFAVLRDRYGMTSMAMGDF
ncbi:polysaccharide deacetylase family protein [Ponticoccus sp. SC2-23]|nr:polysaccharide deacetylase family protein [Ponticoccus sp. SC6-9]MBM1227235.1 polysaccharide deacetylase family protein [Ponticoccus sp. SC6-15]MBM1231779.1 polysaccharide deacetylase family protein [Ponticoccus sp. SC6-38]MBM1236352.1 polysaccharide deacetylase family protein [Ponticoccus sp. SC6-45]MBM1240802.1 polysaccharide deacetylase family protein [Ponticoccus sp. SC6-49]MBM1245337.1 polysaccharide deacetylase family protein [Ponticoccus sp. SC2-64]MBM1249825.1 polysaccharide deacet